MLDRRALRAALCVLSCAWLHAGAASRLKSPALPIQSEREPVPSKGLSGENLFCTVVRVYVRGAHPRGMMITFYWESSAIFTLFLGILQANTFNNPNPARVPINVCSLALISLCFKQQKDI